MSHEARAVRPRPLLELLPCGLLAILLAVALAALQRNYPVAFVKLTTEDWVFEYAGAVGFLLGGLLLVRLAIRPGRRVRRIVWGAMGAAMLFLGMEEISWGQRLIGFATPEAVREANYQKEMNLHNLDGVAQLDPVKRAAQLIPLWLALSAGVLAWRHSRVARRLIDSGVPIVPVRLFPVFLLPCYYALWGPGMVKRDEVAELFLGLAAAAYVVDLTLARQRVDGARARLVGLLAAFGLVAIAACALTLVQHRNPASRLNRAATDDFPALGMHDQAFRVFAHLRTEPELLRDRTRLVFAERLLLRGRKAEAEEVLRETAEVLERRTPPPEHRSRQLRQLAFVHRLQGRAALASEGFEEALRLDRKALASEREPDAAARHLLSIAETLEARGERDAALDTANRARETARSPSERFQIGLWIERTRALPARDAGAQPIPPAP